MATAIRPTLTAAELAELDATVAAFEANATTARGLANACRAIGWKVIATLADWQPNEEIASDYGHWIYDQDVYANDSDDSSLGSIVYDGHCVRVKGSSTLSRFLNRKENQHLWI